MHPIIGYEKDQATAADLRHQAQREARARAAAVMATHHPVAPAHWRQDSRWPADGGRQATRSGWVVACLPGTLPAHSGYGYST